MRYSLSFKESQVKKVLDPPGRSVSSVCRESGISQQTLSNWINKSKEGTLRGGEEIGNKDRSAREKLSIVLESKRIPAEELGRWLREKGLHSEHLTQYEQELSDMAVARNHEEKQETRKLAKENKELKKELRKKEKALAELAALYTLKKKADAIWGGKEED